MIKIPGILRDNGQLLDGTRRLTIYTQEVPPEQLFEVIKHSGKLGVFCFAEGDIKEEDLKVLPQIKTESWEKTPSQRLRAVLFLIWSKGKNQKSFDEFYISWMNDLINKLKEKLDG